jgi:hypothetical protein
MYFDMMIATQDHKIFRQFFAIPMVCQMMRVKIKAGRTTIAQIVNMLTHVPRSCHRHRSGYLASL